MILFFASCGGTKSTTHVKCLKAVFTVNGDKAENLSGKKKRLNGISSYHPYVTQKKNISK